MERSNSPHHDVEISHFHFVVTRTCLISSLLQPKKSKLPQTSLVSYIETVAKDGCDDEVEIVKILISDGADVNLGDGVCIDMT